MKIGLSRPGRTAGGSQQSDPDDRETSTHIQLDRDVKDLQSGRIDIEQCWQRIRARGNGALFGVSIVFPAEKVVFGAIMRGSGRLGKVGGFLRKLFGRGKATSKAGVFLPLIFPMSLRILVRSNCATSGAERSI